MVRLFIIIDYLTIHRTGGALSCYISNCSSSPENSNKKSPNLLKSGLSLFIRSVRFTSRAYLHLARFIAQCL